MMNQNKSLLLLLALCPALAAASTAWAGLALGLLSAVIVLLTCLIRRLLGKLLPERARLIAGLVIAAALATLACLLTEAFLPGVYAVIRELLPALAVQTALLSLAFSQDLKMIHSPALWIGYVIALFAIGIVREFLGAGSLFGCQILGDQFAPVAAISGAPGAFLALAFAGMIINALCLTGKEDES